MEPQEQGAIFDALMETLPEKPDSNTAWANFSRALSLLPDSLMWAVAEGKPILFALPADDVLFTVALNSAGEASVERRTLDAKRLIVGVEILGQEPADPDVRESFTRKTRWTFRYVDEVDPSHREGWQTMTGTVRTSGQGEAPDQREEFARKIALLAGLSVPDHF